MRWNLPVHLKVHRIDDFASITLFSGKLFQSGKEREYLTWFNIQHFRSRFKLEKEISTHEWACFVISDE